MSVCFSTFQDEFVPCFPDKCWVVHLQPIQPDAIRICRAMQTVDTGFLLDCPPVQLPSDGLIIVDEEFQNYPER